MFPILTEFCQIIDTQMAYPILVFLCIKVHFTSAASEHFCTNALTRYNKKAQLSLTNPRDACEKFARFT